MIHKFLNNQEYLDPVKKKKKEFLVACWSEVFILLIYKNNKLMHKINV